MRKVEIKIALPEQLARYLRSTPDAGAVVAEAVAEYRNRQLEREFADAYCRCAEEAERLNRERRSAEDPTN